MENRIILTNIEWLRIISIIAVVFIHIDFCYTYDLLPATRFAVPLFFMISGFFIGDQSKPKKWTKYIVNAFLLLISATAFYAIIEILGAWYNEINILQWPWGKIIIKWLIFNVNPFHYHLWFLGAYLYVICIAACIDKCHLWNSSYWFIIPLLAVRFALQMWDTSYYFSHNFFFIGLPCFLLGSWARNNCHLYIYKLLIWACALFAVLPFLEDAILSNYLGVIYGDFISSYVLAFTLLLLATQSPQYTKVKLPKNTRDIVLMVYILHPFVDFLYRHIIPQKIVDLYYTWLAPFLVFLTTWIGASLFFRGINYIKRRI